MGSMEPVDCPFCGICKAGYIPDPYTLPMCGSCQLKMEKTYFYQNAFGSRGERGPGLLYAVHGTKTLSWSSSSGWPRAIMAECRIFSGWSVSRAF